jgi:hypothetical protein
MDGHPVGIKAFKIHCATVSLPVSPVGPLRPTPVAGFRVTKVAESDLSAIPRHFPVVAVKKSPLPGKAFFKSPPPGERLRSGR